MVGLDSDLFQACTFLGDVAETALADLALALEGLSLPPVEIALSGLDLFGGRRPGVLFALRNVNADDSINRGNRLHPYYLVYLDDQGEVIADHTEAKRLLDLVRAGCRPHGDPVADVTSAFNAATEDGAEMGKYSELLTAAIRSMVDVTEERDVDSLFTDGPTTALTQAIGGLDDFELIAFLAIVDPEETARA